MKTKYTVTLILPKDRTMIEKKYSEVLVDILADMLSEDELGYLTSKLQKKVNIVQWERTIKLTSSEQQVLFTK